MPNAFSKEERVAFEDILEKFSDSLVISKAVSKYGTDGRLMERANDTIWRPMAYIGTSQNRIIGTAVTPSDAVQLSVPSTLGFKRNSTWNMNALELRDALQEDRLGTAYAEKIASDINVSVQDTIALQGSLVVALSTPAGKFDDVALCDSLMNEQGISDMDRMMALTSRDYNGMAANLAVATRSFGNGKSDDAYERALVGDVAGFTTMKTPYARRLVATTATVTIATNGTQVRYVPKATSMAATTEVSNVDNRYQTVTVSTTSGVLAGAAFTIAGIENVHPITKQATGQLKTFRVISIASGTTMVISPPIVGANSSPTAAELQYKNAEVVSTSATAAITWLNRVAAPANVFWHKNSIELLPGRYAIPDADVDIMRASTDQGLEIVMTKYFDSSTYVTRFTLDCLYGVVNNNPEMNGVLLFNQT